MAAIRLCFVLAIAAVVVSPAVPVSGQSNADIKRDADEVRKLIQVDPNERKRWEEETLRQYERDTGAKVDRAKLKPVKVSSESAPAAGGTWLTWRRGDLLGLDKNLPVSGSNEVEQFSVPFIVNSAGGGFKKRRSVTVQ
jgi:hypothetical protein